MAYFLRELKPLAKKIFHDPAKMIGWPLRLATDPTSPTVPPPNSGAGNPQLIPDK
jgi:hypothetical protein